MNADHSNEYEQVLEYWNSLETTRPKAMVGQPLIMAVDIILDHYDMDQIKQALRTFDKLRQTKPDSWWADCTMGPGKLLYSNSSGIDRFERLLHEGDNMLREEKCNLLKKGEGGCNCRNPEPIQNEEGRTIYLVENGSHVSAR